MSKWKAPEIPKTGRCLCGAIQFECRSIYDVVYCHCSTCRRWAGAPAVISANVPAADFFIITGRPQAFRSSETGMRYFCGSCGTHLHFTDGGPFISVNVMTFNEATDIRPRLHQCAASKLDWFEITDDLPRYEDNRIPAPTGDEQL